MTASINASTTSGVVVTSDTSGSIDIQSNGTAVATVASTGTTLAGTTTITTLSDGTNSTSATNCIQGSAKAWVNYKGTSTVAIRASYNVSSVTVVGTGNYTVNFTNALTDANYSALVTCGVTGNSSGSNPEFYGKASNFLAASVNANSRTATGGASDSEVICVAIFR